MDSQKANFLEGKTVCLLIFLDPEPIYPYRMSLDLGKEEGLDYRRTQYSPLYQDDLRPDAYVVCYTSKGNHILLV